MIRRNHSRRAAATATAVLAVFASSKTDNFYTVSQAEFDDPVVGVRDLIANIKWSPDGTISKEQDFYSVDSPYDSANLYGLGFDPKSDALYDEVFVNNDLPGANGSPDTYEQFTELIRYDLGD